jgi:hypothetical protein
MWPIGPAQADVVVVRDIFVLLEIAANKFDRVPK